MATGGRFCASCGRMVDTDSRRCPYCGHDSQERLRNTLQPLETPISGGIRALLYILSLFVPLAGFIIGAIFLTNPGPEHKRVGKICLILAVVGILLMVALAALLYVMVLGFGSTGVVTPTAAYSWCSIPGGVQIYIVGITKTDVPWSDVTIHLTDGTNFCDWRPRSGDLDGGVAVTHDYGTELLGSLTIRCIVDDGAGNGYLSGGDHMSFIATDGSSFSSATTYSFYLEHLPTGEKIGAGCSGLRTQGH